MLGCGGDIKIDSTLKMVVATAASYSSLQIPKRTHTCIPKTGSSGNNGLQGSRDPVLRPLRSRSKRTHRGIRLQRTTRGTLAKPQLINGAMLRA